MAGCVCNVAGEFNLTEEGIYNATLSAGTDIKITSDEIILIGPTIGTLTISAYPYPRDLQQSINNYFGVECPSRVGADMSWLQKYDCDNDAYYVIPVKGGQAWYEGDLPTQVTFQESIIDYDSFNASASSGPASPVLTTTHYDVYNLNYNGLPIQIEAGVPVERTDLLLNRLPAGAVLYLQNFSLDINPPLEATVNYSFLFVYNLP